MKHWRTIVLIAKPALTTLLVAGLWSAGCASRGEWEPADDWPQFRGPNCSGVSHSKKTLPVEFSATENVLWSAEVGDGVGSPVVAAGRVYTVGMQSDLAFSIYCFDVETGEPLWSRTKSIGKRPLPKITFPNSYASSTPAVDSQRLYVYFSTLGLMVFDARDGRALWDYELPWPYYVFEWGPANSPVVYEDKLIFNQDDDENPGIWAFNKFTGDLLWHTRRDEMLASYSVPVICNTGEREELVLAGTGKLIGYDLGNGEQLWQARTLLRNIKTTPVSNAGVVYVSLQSGGIGGQWLAANDKDKDGKLTREEVPEPMWKKFDRGDANGDDILEGDELDGAFLHPDNMAGARWGEATQSHSNIQAVRGGGAGDVTETHVLWKHESRAPDGISSPLVIDDRMLIVKKGGISNCFHTKDGQPIWETKRIDNVGDYFASPVVGDGKIYVTGENGNVVVLESSPELKVLAKNDMGESCLSTPAIADGKLFIRTRTKLYCVAD